MAMQYWNHIIIVMVMKDFLVEGATRLALLIVTALTPGSILVFYRQNTSVRVILLILLST